MSKLSRARHGSKRMRHAGILVEILVLLLLGFYRTAAAQPLPGDPTVGAFTKALISAFAEQRLVPVVSARGNSVGDVYDLSSKERIADGRDCFHALPAPRVEPSSLPSIVSNKATNWGLALQAPQIIDASTGGNVAAAIYISFDEVSVSSLTRLQLINSNPDFTRCPFLQAMINGDVLSADDKMRFYVLVEEVYSARRNVHLIFANEADGKASLDFITSLFRKFSPKAGISVAGQQNNEVWIKDDAVVPVAVRTAFAAKYDTTLGSASAPKLRWKGLDDLGKAQQRAVLGPLVTKTLGLPE